MIFKNKNLRGFISLLLTFSFLILLLSGIVLFIMPHGRIAYWLDWRFLGINKDGWTSVHIMFGIIAVLASLFPLFMFNWKTFLGYVKKGAKKGASLKAELVLSVVLCTVVFIGASKESIPFSSIMDAGESIKKSWVTKNQKPPLPHAELMSIAELCDRLDIPVNDAIGRIRNAGISIKGPGERLAFIAKRNKISARRIFIIMTDKK